EADRAVEPDAGAHEAPAPAQRAPARRRARNRCIRAVKRPSVFAGPGGTEEPLRRPREGSGVLWKGLFIASPTGQDVKAIAPGRVVFADWLRGFGNLLIIDHGDGYMSLYGNNESLFKQVGDAARSGETVAAVGNSGGNMDSGLYFEIRHQGVAFDPLGWVSLR